MADADAPKQASFAQQLAAALEHPDPRGTALTYGRTPALYRMLGFPDLDIRLPPNVLLKLATGKDGTRPPLSGADIRRVFEDLEDPVALFEDLQDDKLVALTCQVDAAGDPIVVALKPNGLLRYQAGNIVLTAFGKENAEAWLARMSQLTVYLGDKKTPGLSLAALDQCQADEGSNGGTKRKILRPDDLRKYKDAQWAGKAAAK